jgi:hypothetical protein
MSEDPMDELKKENERLKAELEVHTSHAQEAEQLSPKYVASWWLWAIGVSVIVLSWLHLVPAIVGWVGFAVACSGSLYSIFLSRRKVN